MYGLAPGPPSERAKFSSVSKIHSATFWRPVGTIFAPRAMNQNTAITTTATIHSVRIVFEMLTSNTTRPGGAWWPTGKTACGAGSSRLPLMKQMG